MKIAMVSENEGRGRWDVHAADLTAALVKLGHEVTVHGSGEPATPPGQEPQLGDFVDALRSDWAEAPPDVVHAHHWRSGLASLLAVQPTGVPVVQSFRGTDRRADVERLVGREAAVVVAGCEDELLEVAASGVSRSRIAVIARGVDVDLFQPQGRTAARSHRRRIVSASGDGVEDVIAALPWLPDAELVVTGPFAPAQIDRVTRRARGLGVQDRIRLTGPVAREKMPALLRSADVVACVPRRSSWDVWPLEAMACGVPVVATAVGGLTDAVTDGVTGVLVPPGEPKPLIRKLRVVLDDVTLRTSCGIAAVDRVQARHTWPDVARGVERLYRRVLEKPAPAKHRRAVC
ncbi:glycosyltransferase [Lentzea sp. NPDC055074]